MFRDKTAKDVKPQNWWFFDVDKDIFLDNNE
jgi:hypothetical protein